MRLLTSFLLGALALVFATSCEIVGNQGPGVSNSKTLPGTWKITDAVVTLGGSSLNCADTQFTISRAYNSNSTTEGTIRIEARDFSCGNGASKPNWQAISFTFKDKVVYIGSAGVGQIDDDNFYAKWYVAANTTQEISIGDGHYLEERTGFFQTTGKLTKVSD